MRSGVVDGLDGRAVVAIAAVLALGAAALVLRRLARRRRARRRGLWAREHARRLPWTLFVRRRTALRLTDARPGDERALDGRERSDKIAP